MLENEDFYLEDDKIVFTEKFHLKRGYCCGSKCRHCPYLVDSCRLSIISFLLREIQPTSINCQFTTKN